MPLKIVWFSLYPSLFCPPMFIGEKELYSPLHLHWVRFLRPNFCSDPNFFSGPKIFKTQKGSWPKFFWTIILLLTKNNLFINQHFFTQNFLGPNVFGHKNVFGTSRSVSNWSELAGHGPNSDFFFKRGPKKVWIGQKKVLIFQQKWHI